MIRKVACIDRKDLKPEYLVNNYIREFTDTVIESDFSKLVFRAKDEVEQNENFKQIIPYVVLINEKNQLALYQRRGNEERLHGLWSAGFGGHIEDFEYVEGINVKTLIQDSALRELQEEYSTQEDYEINFEGIINEEDTKVGRTHIALVYSTHVRSVNFQSSDEIETIKWVDFDDANNFSKELWSDMAIKLITDNHLKFEIMEKPARKVFISVLGTGFYSECFYIKDEFKSNNTRYAQEAILDYCKAKEWKSSDTAIILLTSQAKKTNWGIEVRTIEDRTKNELKEVAYKGLKFIIEDMKLPFHVDEVEIPDGKNADEMWKIFTTIFEKLQDDDELYIDLTHSFRYLPMLLLVLSNYAKFLKGVKIKHLSYGNFEAKNKETNEAPISDLLPLTVLQDWTFAAADYLKNGNIDNLSELSRNVLTPILKETQGKDESANNLRNLIQSLERTIQDFQTCRGVSILKSTNIAKVKKSLKNMESTFIEPLNPLIKKFSEAINEFSDAGSIQNGFKAAQWCYEHGLYQQSATILQENVVSYFCIKYGIQFDNEYEREIVNNVFSILNLGIKDNESEWKVRKENKDKVKKIFNEHETIDKDIYTSFSRLTELRNDINHSGMRSLNKPLEANKIKHLLANEIKLFTEKLNSI